MRLIDADELLENYTSEDMAIGGRDIIKTAPTVEAIPISWLKRWSSSQVASYSMVNEVLFKIRYKPIILHAIEDWEENRNEWGEEWAD